MKALPYLEEDIASYLQWIARAKDCNHLETLFQSYISTYPARRVRGTYYKFRHPKEKEIRAAIEKRGWELVQLHPKSKRIPKLVWKGQWTVEYYGETYKAGRGQNSAGVRYVWAGLECWVMRVGKWRNKDTCRAVLDWLRYGMPHRALRRILRR